MAEAAHFFLQDPIEKSYRLPHSIELEEDGLSRRQLEPSPFEIANATAKVENLKFFGIGEEKQILGASAETEVSAVLDS